MFCTNPDCPDFLATGAHGEFVAGVTTCPYCRQPLAATLEDGGPTPAFEPDPSSEPVVLLETSDPAELEIVKSILTGAEIPFLVRGHEQYAAFRGGHAAFRFNPRAGALVFLVPAQRAEEARALLTEVEPTE
jgi:Putative prokaryotic signal transducing protein